VYVRGVFQRRLQEEEIIMAEKKIKKEPGSIDKKAVEDLKADFVHNREFSLAKDHYTATSHDNYNTLSLSIRDLLISRWIKTQQRYHHENCKRVYYLSLEFLIGRLLGNNVMNLGIFHETEKAMSDLGLNLQDLREQEVDAGLGNGGLGRLAACFLDSMATLGIPATGYGIRYDYGIFKQKIYNGYQVELPEGWLQLGNPWEFGRPEYTINVNFFGKTVKRQDKDGKLVVDWVDTDKVRAIAYDIPVPGYGNDVVNNLRLWSASSTEEFDLEYFNDGDYIKACEKKITSENISRVLYPSDSVSQGLELRLKQEYFFTAASIQDIIRRFKVHNKDFKDFPKKVVIQLNDTHPAIAIIELLRILIDEQGLDWEAGVGYNVKTFAYTNHTVMPEALERWPVSLFEKLLPRHLEIIYELNMRFLKEVTIRYPKDHEKVRNMSLIEEGFDKKVRMCNLAVVGSFSVNGVSKLHTDLLKTTILRDFYDFYPQKFRSITNGITPRRWLRKSNTHLAELINDTIGDGWVRDLAELRKIMPYAKDKDFRKKWADAKRINKVNLATYIKEHMGIVVNPDSMFDVQVKRIHEYKRQILFAFYLIAQYLDIKNNPGKEKVPRTAIIAGKAAPGYAMAKLTIKFINNVANVINSDPLVRDKLKVVFLENYCVSLAERIFPAGDLSEQISTAGKEASGTGNMKLMLNGAVTIGTEDGANIEIAEEVGPYNIFTFGLKADEVVNLRNSGYNPRDYMVRNQRLIEIVDLIQDNFFCQLENGIFNPLIGSLLDRDEYMVFADFPAYLEKQEEVSRVYADQTEWVKKSIANTASAGKFSSDRTIKEYAKDIWKVM